MLEGGQRRGATEQQLDHNIRHRFEVAGLLDATYVERLATGIVDQLGGDVLGRFSAGRRNDPALSGEARALPPEGSLLMQGSA